MPLSAQISLYPLRREHLGPSIEAVRVALEDAGLAPEVGPMSTLVRGEPERLWPALRDAFERAAAEGDVAMVLTVSNACPAQGRTSGGAGDL